MRVLIISQYFRPEATAAANRIISLANGLQNRGHDVVVVTAKPNHPDGIIPKEYRGGIFRHDLQDGISTIHAWVYARAKNSLLVRLLNYGTFAITGVIGALRAAGPFDIVLSSSPPLSVGISGALAARLLGARFVFDVRDLWPDVAVAMGKLSGSMKVSLAKGLERFIYDKADGITATTGGFCDSIRGRSDPKTPVKKIMNGTEPDIFKKDESGTSVRERHGIKDRFVVTYAGNLGICQGLNHIIEAAGQLENELSDVLFRFIGSGPVEERLQSEVHQRGLQNVVFVGRLPLKKAAAHMAAADALLVPLADHEIYHSFIPSKLFDSMAAGRPVLLSVDGEARQILNSARAGRYYPAEDGHALAEEVRWLYNHPDVRSEMGRNGRKYAEAHCSREVQARKMAMFLERVSRTSD